jgi:hypothetical protein
MCARTQRGSVAVTLLLLVAGGPVGRAYAASPITVPPEVIARLPSGEYSGGAQNHARAFDVSLVVHESKPGGRFQATAAVHPAPAACGAQIPLSGEMRPDGAVRIDSMAAECPRRFELRLAGEELKGTMTGPEGPSQVILKKR